VFRRLARRILNLVLQEMSKARARDKEVEFPFEKLKRVRRHFSNYLDRNDDCQRTANGNQAPTRVNYTP
jgi:hypothetical protein